MTPNDFYFLKNKETPQQSLFSVAHQTISQLQYHFRYLILRVGLVVLPEHMLANSHPRSCSCCCFSLDLPSTHSLPLSTHLNASLFVASSLVNQD